eukprot:COSAG01_NODE_56744_length_316_cov_1.119816_1_plen_46_part_01
MSSEAASAIAAGSGSSSSSSRVDHDHRLVQRATEVAQYGRVSMTLF